LSPARQPGRSDPAPRTDVSLPVSDSTRIGRQSIGRSRLASDTLEARAYSSPEPTPNHSASTYRSSDPISSLNSETDRPPDLKFEAGSSGGVSKDALKVLHPLGSGAFKKVETEHADTFEFKPDEAG
jgi:hypothetical protein